MVDYLNGDLSEEIVQPDYFNGELVSGIEADYFNGDLVGGDILPVVPVPGGVRGDITAYRASDQRYRVTLSIDAPIEGTVDSYEFRSNHNMVWRSTAMVSSNRQMFGMDSWIEVRSVLGDRYSDSVRLNFADLTFPQIGVPGSIVVSIIEQGPQLFHVELEWDPPQNAFGRTVRYYVDRGGTGFAYQTSGQRLRYLAPRSTFPYFSVRAEASGEESEYVRVNDADYIDLTTLGPPQNVAVSLGVASGAGRTATITLEAPANGVVENYAYQVDDGDWTDFSGLSVSVNVSSSVQNISVRAENRAVNSTPVTVARADWTDPYKPQNVVVTYASASSYLVTWDAPSHGTPQKYRIHINGSDWVELPNNVMTITLTGNADFIELAAQFDDEWWDAVCVYESDFRGGAIPHNFAVERTTDDSSQTLSLSWDAPFSGNPDTYEIRTDLVFNGVPQTTSDSVAGTLLATSLDFNLASTINRVRIVAVHDGVRSPERIVEAADFS